MSKLETVEAVVRFCERMKDDCWAKMRREPGSHTRLYAHWEARYGTFNFIIEQITGPDEGDDDSPDSDQR